MKPEERIQLLAEQASKALVLPEKEVRNPDLEREQRELQRLEDAAAIEAFKQKPQSVGEILRANIGLCRKALDPRVLLEAKDIGLSDVEMEKKLERMQRWAEAVLEKREGESFEQRHIRLRSLMDELFDQIRTTGCECAGKGWVLTIGDMRLKRDKVVRNVEHYRTCDCAKGEAKLEEIARMGKQRNIRRGKKNSTDEVVPF